MALRLTLNRPPCVPAMTFPSLLRPQKSSMIICCEQAVNPTDAARINLLIHVIQSTPGVGDVRIRGIQPTLQTPSLTIQPGNKIIALRPYRINLR